MFGEFNSVKFDANENDKLFVESELICDDESGLIEVPLAGNWIMDSFYGPMANVQRFSNGQDEVLHTDVKDVIHTMDLVQTLIESHESKGYSVRYTQSG